jgi:16S rRNA processing protein RimM
VSRPPHWLHAGRVGRPHGLDGSFHVTRPNSELLRDARRVRIEDREVEITRRAGTDRSPILRLAGHDDRGAAESLRGMDILVERSQAPALGPDEWWADDLVGCAVHDGEREVGTVTRLVELPSCEALEVQRPGAAALLVPLVTDAVRDVDLEQRAIDVDLQFLGEA